MKLLDNLVLTSFTTLVSIVFIDKVVSKGEQYLTIETNLINSTKIIVEWKNRIDTLKKPSCISLKISSDADPETIYKDEFIESRCIENNNLSNNERCNRQYYYTTKSLKQCTNYKIEINCETMKMVGPLKQYDDKNNNSIETRQLTSYNSSLEPVKNITTNNKKNLIQIRWDESKSHKLCIKRYDITLISKSGYISKTTTHNGFLLTDLKAGEIYSGNATAVYNDDKEIISTIQEFTTHEKLKRPKFYMSAESKDAKTAVVTWETPNIDHQYSIQSYEILYYIMNDNNPQKKIKQVPFNDKLKIISSLEPCKYYNLTIKPRILNYDNDLSATTEVFVVDQGTCMKSTNEQDYLSWFKVDPKTNTFYFPKRFFITYTEKIVNYSIFLYLDNGNERREWPSIIISSDSPNTWADMELNPSSVFIYRSTPNNWRFINEDGNGNFVYKFGDNKECSKEYGKKSFCNGPLKSKRRYKVAVSACSERGCVASESRDFFATDEKNNDDNTNNPNSISLIMIFVLIPAGILFLAVVIYMLRAIRVENYNSIHSIIKKSMPSDMTFQQLLSKTLEDMETEYNLFDVSMKSNPTTYIAMLPKNRSKNRYSDILPYDFNRVELKSANDYINASFIYDFDNIQKYIACQGPMTNTCVDMWQMVMEQNVVSIVMLCKMIENDKRKCDKYFPNVDEILEFGDITVQNYSTVVNKNRSFTTNQITIVKGNTQKKINHFQFHDWPDFGTPDEYSMLLDFYKKVNTESLDGLIVVHCSAGVGRTGTYIACDLLLKSINQSEKLNIFKTVLHLRKQRTNMVQTQEQYNFIYGFLGNYINPYL